MHMRFLAGALALAAAAGVTRAAAQDTKAAEVVAAARRAIGDGRLEGLKTLSVEASVQRNVKTIQLTSEVEILLALPERYLRAETSSGPMGGGFTVGFNGDKIIRPANGLPMGGGGMVIRIGPGGPPPSGEKLSPEEQDRADKEVLRSHRNEISRFMLGWFAMTHPAIDAEYVYAGAAEAPDGRAHVIDVKHADGFSARLFIDQETHLPLMVTYQAPQPRMVTFSGPPPGAGRGAAPPDGGRVAPDREGRGRPADGGARLEETGKAPPAPVETTLFFEDWRAAGGIKFPHVIRRASGGTTTEEWTVTRVRVNPKLDGKRFDG